MAEEQRFESQEQSLRLCANNCGFFGSSATMNLCSKCYRDHHLKEEQSSTAKIAVEKSLAASSSSSESSTSSDSITTVDSNVSLPALILPESADEDYRSPIVAALAAVQSPSDRPEITSTATKPNRCSTCRKKVGLTGFPCRCGITFCGTHRYPEQHGCTFDFKGVGRDAIAKANPVVKGQKLEKI